MRVLLTGASGFIGARVASELRTAGAEVYGFCPAEPPAEAGVAEWVNGDVRDAAAIASAIRGCETVIHTAAVYSYDRSAAQEMVSVNVGGTRNVLDAAIQAGIRRMVMTSSSATCGPVPGRPANELDSPPLWELRVPYKRTKVASERAVLAAGAQIDVVCVNPTTVVGPGDTRPTPSGQMVRDLVAGRMRAYLKGAGINAVAVDDVARGHLLALERGRSGERYILGSDDVWLQDAFAAALAAVGRKPPRVGVPWRAVHAAAVGADAAERLLGLGPGLLVLDEVRLARVPLFFSSDKARNELGYRPRPAVDALAHAARWYATRAGSAGGSGAGLAARIVGPEDQRTPPG